MVQLKASTQKISIPSHLSHLITIKRHKHYTESTKNKIVRGVTEFVVGICRIDQTVCFLKQFRQTYTPNPKPCILPRPVWAAAGGGGAGAGAGAGGTAGAAAAGGGAAGGAGAGAVGTAGAAGGAGAAAGAAGAAGAAARHTNSQ